MRSRILVLVLLSFALFGAVRAGRAQSLADVARKEQERRKTVKDGGRTFTNKDLPNTPVPTTSASNAAKAPPTDAAQGTKAPSPDGDKATDASKGDKDKDGDKPKGQKDWADRMKELRAALDRDVLLAEALQTRVNALTTDFVNRGDPAQRAVIAQNKQKAEDELARLNHAVEDEKKAIGDLEEEARRAGVPPGWLR
jgi:hypothetical protein